MKTKYIFASLLVSLSMTTLYGQGETDALKLSQSDISGSARYMGMAGAFGALGGDISSLTQNPAGIGVYRSSEIVATFGFENTATEVDASGGNTRSSDFRFVFNNIGAVGTLNTGKSSGLVNFNFGFAYNRLKNYNRSYQAKFDNLETSLTNYIADKTNGISVSDLTLTDNYDPYNYLSWLPVLAYESSLISPEYDGIENVDYFGLFNGPKTISYNKGAAPSSGYADLWVTEKGRIDEYTLNLGGNISDRIYFGLGVGILDINYTQRTEYKENITNPEYLGPGEAQPDGNINLRNYLHTRGTGVNLKLGLMARLTHYWRVGLAFHTPTVYSMRDEYMASVRNTAILEPVEPDSEQLMPIERSTPDNHIYYTDYRYSSPWKLIASTAFILGKKGLVSFDYEYAAYNRMRLSDGDGVAIYGDYDSNVDDFIRTDFKGGHTFRVGGEYRPTGQLSLRAGYAGQLSPVTKEVFDMNVEVVTAGTQPMYTLNKDTHYFTAGAGYRFGRLYLDAAYVHRMNREDVLPYSPVFIGDAADMPEVAKLTGHNNSFILTLGYKF